MRVRRAFVFLFLLLAPAAEAATGDGVYDWPVLGAIDGDTIKVRMPGLPAVPAS